MVAEGWPGRSISMVSRTRAIRSWICATTVPSASLSFMVSRNALPSTLKARRPPVVSIHKSSPMLTSFSRMMETSGPPGRVEGVINAAPRGLAPRSAMR